MDNDGLRLLKHPILPIVRIVQFLYLTGPFKDIASVLRELLEPIETASARYEDPAALLQQYVPVLRELEVVKNRDHHPLRPLPPVVDEKCRPMNKIIALQLWISQQVLTMELEAINSLLCRPCGCVLCCVGPDYGEEPGSDKKMQQHFFEIPLGEQEVELFDLPKIDDAQSRRKTANSEESLLRENKPFYKSGPALYNWKNGWGLILPRQTACPHLDREQGVCRIYRQRPEVCRRPQIFPYALEKQVAGDGGGDGRGRKTVYVATRKLLAVWDCPYVRELKEEIAGYAEMCELEPVFRENKR